MVCAVRSLLESGLQLTPGLAGIAAHGIVILGAVVLAGLATIVVRRVLVRLATRLAVRTETRWDDVLIKSGVVRRVAPLAPVIVIYLSGSVFGSARPWIETLLLVCLVGLVFRVIDALFDAGLEIYEDYPVSRELSARGFVRFGRVGVAVLGTILVVATVLDRVPLLLGDELDAVLRADRADSAEDIPALLDQAREALERVRDHDAQLSAEGREFLRAVRDRGPALVDAVARRVAEIAEGEERPDGRIRAVPGDHVRLSESLRELCKLVSETGTDLAGDPPELGVDSEEGWPTLAESCRKIEAALEESSSGATVPREVR
jgi:hypothetical protein